jgi:ADP-heptose:LPS heptosyltransferase
MSTVPAKILVIRFSSIGDIVLTSPVLRCIKRQLPGTKLHVATKSRFAEILQANPYVDSTHAFTESVSELFDPLRQEKFDLVIDLHKNLRSRELIRALAVKSITFDKINLRKYLAVNFKLISALPAKHVVDRYFDAVKMLGVKNDEQGCEYFIPESEKMEMAGYFPEGDGRFNALVLGASYYTKKIPFEKLHRICSHSALPLVLIGGEAEMPQAEQLKQQFPSLVNLCGVLSLHKSASVISQAEWVITPDTGMMHIAAAFKKKIISVWGNTIPEFGMYPYLPHPDSLMLQVNDLSCRPCSKLGYSVCPLGHFKCMREIDYGFVGGLTRQA